MTAGHPYLTQRLCQAIANEGGVNAPADLDRLCEMLFFSSRAREQDDNLLFVRERILRSEVDLAGLLHLYEKVLRRKPVPDDETNPLLSVLRLSGIVRVLAGRLIERNRIYRRAFNPSWVRQNLPDAEVRRQRAAFRRGVIRTAAVALLISATFALLGVYAFSQARRADSIAKEEMHQRQRAEATLISGFSNLAEIAAKSSAMAVMFDDPIEAENDLANISESWVSAESGILLACICIFKEGKLWVKYPKELNEAALPGGISESGYSFEKNALTLFRPIVHPKNRGKEVGIIRIRWSLVDSTNWNFNGQLLQKTNRLEQAYQSYSKTIERAGPIVRCE